MEDTLREVKFIMPDGSMKVLILVLMEDTLRGLTVEQFKMATGS